MRFILQPKEMHPHTMTEPPQRESSSGHYVERWLCFIVSRHVYNHPPYAVRNDYHRESDPSAMVQHVDYPRQIVLLCELKTVLYAWCFFWPYILLLSKDYRRSCRKWLSLITTVVLNMCFSPMNGA